MFRLGLQVLGTHLGDVLDPARIRTALRVGIAVAALSVVGLSVLEARVAWSGHGPVRSAVAIALLSVGTGLLAFGFVPTRRRVGPEATINGRQVRPDWRLAARPSVAPYLRSRELAVARADRDAVLVDTVLVRAGLIGMLARGVPLLTAGLLASVGLLSIGAVHFAPVAWCVLYTFGVPEYVVRLGRTERARRSALQLDEG